MFGHSLPLLAALMAAPVEEPDPASVAAAASNAFATDLYGKLATGDGNLFVSPVSISTALGMAYAGAAGDTAAEIAKTLHLPQPPEKAYAAFGSLQRQLVSAPDLGVELALANDLWAQQGYALKPTFTTVLQRDFGAALRSVDFSKPNQAAAAINGRVENVTRGRIKDLLPADALRDARLVLTNAVYFKGDWQMPFSKTATRPEDFRTAAGATVKVPLMRRTGTYRYFEQANLQGLELPYKDNRVNAVVLLPRKPDGLKEVERHLSAGKLDDWLKAMGSQEVSVLLPKFRMEQRFDLGQTLERMGMPTAFSDRADFSGITDAEGLKISKVIHKTFVELDEKGTEAAAATGVVITRITARIDEPKQIPEFRVDRPFLFLIKANNSSTILFLGRITDPTKG